ncbi:transposase [Xenorhabdus miraniensis]|uniref:Transposase n=1 Tax=Xenorhabdus miraniensis TaxID=351674 RepID=A0A2D0JPN1_9GAMM|nr:transposase [Xenorhabdus miraniensis]PHM48210.1 transposase [Xenorhabdus miraniensis]
MKLKSSRHQYSTKFKLEAIQQVLLHQQRIVDVARLLDIDTCIWGKWVHQYKNMNRLIRIYGVKQDHRLQSHCDDFRLSN